MVAGHRAILHCVCNREDAMIAETAHADGWQLEGNSAEAYERYLATAFSPWADALTAAAELTAGDRVLDVACGTGIVARHAARRVGAGGTVVGLDVNEAMLAVARSVSAGCEPSIEWRQGDAAYLPFPDRQFDAVFSEQAVQFFPAPLEALREMRRVLAAEGRAAISVCPRSRSARHTSRSRMRSSGSSGPTPPR
jgi:ubiquinone/menaquinone biosynthesis C-methylase UbiE